MSVIHILKYLKEELAWTTCKWLQFFINIISVIPLAMWSSDEIPIDFKVYVCINYCLITMIIHGIIFAAPGF